MTVVGNNRDLCKSCYSCVWNCPANAIKVELGQARIVDEHCVNCGICLKVCPHGAIDTMNQIYHVKNMIKNGHKVVAMLDLSYPISFHNMNSEALYEALKEIGFTQVVDVSAGVSLSAAKYRDLLMERTEPLIGSQCPAVVELIEKKYPNLIPYLAPVDSCVTAMAKHLKNGDETLKNIYIGPCTARKQEAVAFGEGYVDGVLTFPELKELLGRNEQENLACGEAVSRGTFPVAGAFIKAVDPDGNLLNPEEILVIQGKEECLGFLNNLAEGIGFKPRYADIYFCKGCIDGPLVDSCLDFYSRRAVLMKGSPLMSSVQGEKDENLDKKIDLSRQFTKRQNVLPVPSEGEIRAILTHTFKSTEEYELNCGLCGYQTCRQRAVAVYQGLTEIDMCLPYLLAQSRGEIDYYKNQFGDSRTPTARATGLVGSSQSMKQIRNLIAKVSQNEATILLQGESGVGKEVVAKAIHNLSGRKKEPFVGINCAALPELLLESELFGYEDGAFTGARKGGKEGRFELASGGTILLDEIGDLPLAMQAKLLRVLQEKEFTRLGGTVSIPLNARIITATNKDLRQMVGEGKFRADLYYRINVISIRVPSLKERKEDIPALMGHFLHKIAADKAVLPKIFSDEALEIMLRYDWPGNIRELENIIERLIYVSEGNVIKAEDLPGRIRNIPGTGLPTELKPLKQVVQDLERDMIIKALQAAGNNKVKAAGLLGLPRASFYQKLKDYALMS